MCMTMQNGEGCWPFGKVWNLMGVMRPSQAANHAVEVAEYLDALLGHAPANSYLETSGPCTCVCICVYDDLWGDEI